MKFLHNDFLYIFSWQGGIPFLCPSCESGSFEEDAVKIVKVKLGYVSVVVKLKRVESLQCALFCKLNHHVPVGCWRQWEIASAV